MHKNEQTNLRKHILKTWRSRNHGAPINMQNRQMKTPGEKKMKNGRYGYENGNKAHQEKPNVNDVHTTVETQLETLNNEM